MGLCKGDTGHQLAAGLPAWRLPIIVLVVSAALALCGDLGREWLQFDRLAIGDGQWWRFLTGHFVHLGTPHLLLNAAGLLLVWYLVGATFTLNQWLLIGAGSIFVIGLGFWFLQPQLNWYVGLSGLLHGLLAAGIVTGLRKAERESIVLAVLLFGKLAYEQAAGPLPGSEASSGGAVIVAAHLYGALGGVMIAILLWAASQPVSQSS